MARIGNRRVAYSVLRRKPDKEKSMEDLGVDGRILK